MRVVLVLATLLVVSLAGCTSDDDSELVDSSSDASSQAAPSDEPDAAESEDEVIEEPEIVAEPYKESVSGSGATSTGVRVCDSEDGTGECTGHEIDAHSRFVTFDYADPLVGASFELSWERVDGTLRILVVEVYALPDEGEPVRLFSDIGTSPIRMDLPDAEAGPGTLQFEVWPRSNAGAATTYLFVDPQSQEFDIEGEMTLMPAEA